MTIKKSIKMRQLTSKSIIIEIVYKEDFSIYILFWNAVTLWYCRQNTKQQLSL